MPEPTVLDVRRGLTEEAIERLRHADRVQLALKDARTAVLGLWPSSEQSEPWVALLLRVRPFVSPGSEAIEPLDMLGPASGDLWSRVASALRPGDHLVWIGREPGSVLLGVDAPNHIFTSTYRMALGAVRWRAGQSN